MNCNVEEKSKSWCRAIITDIVDNDLVKVFRIDYGTYESLSIQNCRFLDKKFGQVKAQAILAQCGGIQPLDTIWTEQSCALFKELTNATNKKVVLRFQLYLFIPYLPNYLFRGEKLG